MNSTMYNRSYVEVLEILKHIPKEEYEKIPEEKIQFYKNNIDKNYLYIYDHTEPKTLRETDAILINLYKSYIAGENEKKEIDDILKANEIKANQEKQKKFSSDNIFCNKDIKIGNKDERAILVKRKETIFRKIMDKIKQIFKINQ